nr:hypothetical protein [Tanacetum cinerariifolium]
MDTKFAKPSILGKPILQPHKNQSVVRQPNAFKSERSNSSKPQFASQVDVITFFQNHTPHYLPKVREYVLAKFYHVIAHGSSRNSQEESYGSDDIAHNHYLEEDPLVVTAPIAVDLVGSPSLTTTDQDVPSARKPVVKKIAVSDDRLQPAFQSEENMSSKRELFLTMGD